MTTRESPYTFRSAVYAGDSNTAGEREGHGTLTDTDGESYVGAWKAGKREGQGTLTDTYGSVYVGAWKAGKREGQGTLTSADGEVHVPT